MSKIIKKGEKFYRQTIEEEEIELKVLEDNIAELKKDKTANIARETQNWTDQIKEIQDEINQIKSL